MVTEAARFFSLVGQDEVWWTHDHPITYDEAKRFGRDPERPRGGLDEKVYTLRSSGLTFGAPVSRGCKLFPPVGILISPTWFSI
jgi:hypothetical protein